MTKDFLKSHFSALCLAAVLIFLYPTLVFPKGELELLINRFHSNSLDFFFKYITHLGDGSLLAVLLIVFLFISYSSTIIAAFSIALQAIIVSLFKRWLYKGLERPLGFFDEGISLNFVDGVDVHNFNTFPSGHTATGFALFALVFLVVKNKGVITSVILFTLAFCVGFSRVYLLQHFVIDVYFGAIFGILSIIFGILIYEFSFKSNQKLKLKESSLRDLLMKKST